MNKKNLGQQYSPAMIEAFCRIEAGKVGCGLTVNDLLKSAAQGESNFEAHKADKERRS